MKNETELQELIENYCADMLDQQREEAERYYHQISGDSSYKMAEIGDNLIAIDWDRLEFGSWVAIPAIELPWNAPSIENIREAGLGLAFYHIDEDEEIDDNIFYEMDYLSNHDNSENIKKCIKALENYPKEAQ